MVSDQALKESQDLEQRLRLRLPEVNIISQRENLIFVRCLITKQVSLEATLLFVEDYPKKPLIIQLKSKTLSDKLLDGLSKLLDDNAKSIVGQYQVLPQLEFLVNYLKDNVFCRCFDEFQKVKKELCSECVEMKAKQKTGTAIFTISIRNYKTVFKLTIPEHYPDEAVVVDTLGFKSNLPQYLTDVILRQATEEARKCVEPPLNKKMQAQFTPQPSFYKIAKFLISDSFVFFKTTLCKLCDKPAFPEDANDIRLHNRDPLYVERVYCTHLYHFGCLHTYITTPPFGKKCVICDLVIYHERWKETPQVLQDRWAHKQAKMRELDEVVDFLQ